MNKRQFKASEFINSIYKNGKKPVSLEYCDDDAVYNITCTLNWTKEQKDDFIDRINKFNNSIKVLSKFSKKESNAIYNKYFKDTKKYIFKDYLKIRVYRLSKLNVINAPKIVIDNEFQLLITLLIINIFAVKDSITKEIKEDLTKYG